MRPLLLAATAAALAIAANACATTDADGPQSPPTEDQSAPRSPDIDTSAHRVLPVGLAASVEAQSGAFLERDGTALRRNLRRFLGSQPTTEVERGSAVCRSGGETPSIADPRRHPFACIVRATADGQGLEVEIVLGFVGTELEGRCWRAANERVAVTTSLPELLSRREARRPVNQVAGCV